MKKKRTLDLSGVKMGHRKRPLLTNKDMDKLHPVDLTEAEPYAEVKKHLLDGYEYQDPDDFKTVFNPNMLKQAENLGEEDYSMIEVDKS